MNNIEIPSKEKFTEKFFIYYGCDTIEEMVENIEKVGLNKAKCYYIKFYSQYYAVFFESFEKEIIIGKDKLFYTKNGRLEETTVGEAKIGYTINHRDVKWITDTLARELNSLDQNIELYEYPNIKSKNYRLLEGDDYHLSNYVVLLGVTFSSKFYTLYTAEEMNLYFKHTDELISFMRRTKGVVSIDPFSQEVKFKDGSIGTYSYKRVNDFNYYGRSRGYNPNSSYGFKTIFVLQDKNKYSPFRKREWTSITRYQTIYPDDFILYPMPDYRSDKATCKWCGNKLPDGKKSYCSLECRLEYGKAVNLERNALLPYLIMCRDNFCCTECGLDMALINKHGQKLPIPRLCEYPDSDGKYRSEAEVDHIKPIEEGGTDHQSNLGTKCQQCHKAKHKTRLKKSEREEIKKAVMLHRHQ